MTLKERFRQIKKFPDWIYWLPSRLMLLMTKVMRHEHDDPNDLFRKYAEDPGKRAVVVIWHNRLLFFAPMCPKVNRERAIAVISASRDGQYIADLCAQFGVESVRGSTSRGGMKVLLNAFKKVQDGNLIVFTPDGPRGPKYKLSKGPIHVASQMGIPVIPIAVNSSSYWQLGSWDAFQIPAPWSKLTLKVGDEIMIPPNLSAEEFEVQRQRVEAALREISIDRESSAKQG